MTTLEFNALVRQYQGLVYTVCHQLVPDEGDAQDLAQETFLAAWRAIDRCPPGYEKQWLARIASNKAKDYLRSAWVRRVNTPGDDILALEGAPPGSDPEQQVLDAMSEETLTGKILGMREPYRTPCRLMLLEGRTARLRPGAAGAGCHERGDPDREDPGDAGAVPHPLPPDAAGGPHRRRGGSPLRQAPKDGGGADLPGKENAGGADPSGKEERRWNCFVKMAA